MVEKEGRIRVLGKELRPHAIWALLAWLGPLAGSSMIAVVAALWQKLRHISLDWFFIVGLFLLSFILLALLLYMARKISAAPKTDSAAPRQKLVIHSAVYGTGPLNDIVITDKLQNAQRDGLVIPVDNSLVPTDPAYGQPKRLEVDYSYGNNTRFRAVRWEGSRLSLPEDTELSRLTQALATTTKGHRKLEAENESRARAEIMELKNKLNQRHSKSLDWGGEWKLAEDSFRLHYKSEVCAQRTYETPGKFLTWRLFGGTDIGRAEVEAACSKAGALLLSCPGFETVVSQQVKAIKEDWKRWLEYLKEKHPLTNVMHGTGHDADEGRSLAVQTGDLYSVAPLSASECVKSAATAIRFKELW